MPRETIQYGRDYAIVSVPETAQHGAYEYEVSAEEAKRSIADDEISKSLITFSTKPHVDLNWSRPLDKLSLPIGEEAVGSVQVSISLAPQDMQRRIDHIKAHPEDLEAFSIFHSEPLTRSQINHFIRTLKRARDTAYGSDE